MLNIYEQLIKIIECEYSDIVKNIELIGGKSIGSKKLRIHLLESSFIDIWISEKGRYSYHWERRAKTGEVFRQDNAPDFNKIKTYPKHFHDGSEQNVIESHISNDPQMAIKQFLKFVRTRL